MKSKLHNSSEQIPGYFLLPGVYLFDCSLETLLRLASAKIYLTVSNRMRSVNKSNEIFIEMIEDKKASLAVARSAL